MDKKERIEETIERMLSECDILVAIPRMLSPTADELSLAFKEFNWERKCEIKQSRFPLKITVMVNGIEKTFIYAETSKVTNPEYKEQFISMCQETGDSVCICGMMYASC